MAAWGRKVATESYAFYLACSAAFNGDKGGHFATFRKALLGELVDEHTRPEVAEAPRPPIDLASDEAKAIQMEMEAEQAMFEQALARCKAQMTN